MTQSLEFDPDRLQWEIYEVTPDYRRWIAPLDETRSVMKTEYLGDERLLAENKQLLDDSHGKRFGDGVIAARIPLNVLYSSQHQLIEKMQEGDLEHMSWWLNRAENQQYRTFRGVVGKPK